MGLDTEAQFAMVRAKNISFMQLQYYSKSFLHECSFGFKISLLCSSINYLLLEPY